MFTILLNIGLNRLFRPYGTYKLACGSWLQICCPYRTRKQIIAGVKCPVRDRMFVENCFKTLRKVPSGRNIFY